jgi:tetratricopeptide (TPR) repeat protein
MAYADGRFEDALHDFRRAYELSGRAELLFNIGSAAERLRLDAEALEAYEAYLEQVPDAENSSFVKSRVDLLRRQIHEDEARAAERTASEEPAGSVDAPAESPSEKKRLVGKWWFWTAVVAVVAGGVVTGAVLASSSSDTPFVGTDGVTYEALTVARW